MHASERQIALEADIARLEARRVEASEHAYGRATRVHIFAVGGMICGVSIGLAGLTSMLAIGITLFGISAFAIGVISLYVGFRKEREVRLHRKLYAQLVEQIARKEEELRSLMLQADSTTSSASLASNEA
ncbi:hypothetical protein [Pseudomonas sp. Marseille-QA0892]